MGEDGKIKADDDSCRRLDRVGLHKHLGGLRRTAGPIVYRSWMRRGCAAGETLEKPVGHWYDEVSPGSGLSNSLPMGVKRK